MWTAIIHTARCLNIRRTDTRIHIIYAIVNEHGRYEWTHKDHQKLAAWENAFYIIT